MEDLRAHEEVRGLDKSGFDYLSGVPTSFSAWGSDGDIMDRYYAETAECAIAVRSRRCCKSLRADVFRLLIDRLKATRVMMWASPVSRLTFADSSQLRSYHSTSHAGKGRRGGSYRTGMSMLFGGKAVILSQAEAAGLPR